MSRTSSDEQLAFLLKCVKHSNNGKVDFAEVAKECGIVSKGAAAKRYERMMKANGINPNGGPTSPPGQSSAAGSSPKPPKSTTPGKAKASGGGKSSTTRKRTAANGGGGLAKKMKAETGAEGEDYLAAVKREDGTDAPNGLQEKMRTKHDPFLSDTATSKSNEEDSALFTEFCNTHTRSEEPGPETERSNSSDKKHSNFLADILGDDEAPLVKEEPEYA